MLIRVLHDWRDEDCLRILRACRAAMGPDALLLIGEQMLEPDPARGRPTGYLRDMQMMAMFGSARERTEASSRPAGRGRLRAAADHPDGVASLDHRSRAVVRAGRLNAGFADLEDVAAAGHEAAGFVAPDPVAFLDARTDFIPGRADLAVLDRPAADVA